MMTYKEAIQYIHSISWRGSRPGLERIRVLCDLLGNPQDKLSFIHVAGTNGKGSVCSMLAEIYRRAGYQTGMFTSPYVYRFNERMAVNGTPISDRQLTEIIEEIRPLAESMKDPPTEFELITAAAFLFFYKQRCQIVILECGMGGRLDSTNIIKNSVASVITSIGLDHTAQLGKTVAEIAKEKAGIIKHGCPVILGSSDAAVLEVVREKAALEDAPVHPVDFSKLRIETVSLEGTQFSIVGEKDPYSMKLLGKYQPHNAMIAIETARVVGISGAYIHSGIEHVHWPARFEILRRDPLVIFDGGHNPQGIDAVAETIEQLFPNKVNVLTGVMADKEYAAIVRRLQKIAVNVYCVAPENPRALPADKYAVVFAKAGIPARPVERMEDALEIALENSRAIHRPLLIVGSLYMYKDILDSLEYLELKRRMQP
ncbi:MAG: bifunctional folylpolyglutamate synthase/dihydrofolate synthase [Clostridiales bacterium]|nr:bifunctional folylpolyglutamate synthase/dihydrofolate synthase [Clostridiales bacterium]